jgi:hypothetical protein
MISGLCWVFDLVAAVVGDGEGVGAGWPPPIRLPSQNQTRPRMRITPRTGAAIRR